MKKGFLSMFLMVLILLTCTAFLPTTGTNEILPKAEGNDLITITRAEYEELQKYKELEEIRQVVHEYYYQEIDDGDLLEGAAAGMLDGIDDPYTFYYTPEDFAKMWEDDEGEYAGVGMQITASYVTQVCTITRVFLNSPALEAGIRRGDILIKVEDLDVTADTLQDAVDIMRGEVGKPVNIQVLRGDELKDFVVVRAVVKTNYVNSCMLDDQIGYISLYEFSGSCSTDFEKQFRELEAKGAKALIIDLRDNPGGWVNDAQSLADLFLGDGLLATLQYKDGTQDTYRTTNSPTDSLIPLVVIVNENSASASEILSGALQDRGRATILGVQSFGKGIVQWVLDVGSRGAGMQLTVAQYFTPNGNEVHKIGITPDVIVEMPEEETDKLFELGDLSDTQLRAAYEEAKKLLKK